MNTVRWIALCVWSLVSLWLPAAQGQELLRNERNEMGTLINQDYYTLDQHPETIALLRLVEYGHFSQPLFDAFRAGYYKSVVGDLKYVLERIANHPGALSMLSTVAIVTKINNLPIPFYEKALKLYPDYAFTHAQYGYYLIEIGAMDKAVEHLKAATKIDPQMPSGHAWLAEAYYKTGKLELAKQEEAEARKLGYTKPIPMKEAERSTLSPAPAPKGGKKKSSGMQLSQSDAQ